MSECLDLECSSTSHARGYCRKHYARRSRAGEFTTKLCLIEGCDGPAYTSNLCSKHYQRKESRARGVRERVKGDPGKWRKNSKGYVLRERWSFECNRKVTEWQHRMVMEGAIGRALFAHEEVHHRNGMRDDNHLENLELWSTSQPKGQRIEDKIAWAKELLEQYGYIVRFDGDRQLVH